MRRFTIVVDRSLLARLSDTTDLFCKIGPHSTVKQLLEVVIEQQPHLASIIFDEDGRPSSSVLVQLGTPVAKVDISSLAGIDTVIGEDDTHLYVR